METIKARYNCGNWIWDCLDCNSANSISPGDEMAYCGGCYKDKLSRYDEIREKTMQEAWANGDVYKIVFPENHAEIESFLANRRKEHRSWEIGETIKDLEVENQTHRALQYLKIKPKKKKREKPSESLSELNAGRIK